MWLFSCKLRDNHLNGVCWNANDQDQESIKGFSIESNNQGVYKSGDKEPLLATMVIVDQSFTIKTLIL